MSETPASETLGPVSRLAPEDINRIARRILDEIHEERHNFAVPPQQHYDEHADMRTMLNDYKMAKGLFWKAFIGLAVIGASALALLGLTGVKFH